MKKDKIVFYSTTIMVSGMMLFSAYLYLTSPDLKASFQHIGFPDFFRIEVAIAKALGAIALLLPMTPFVLRVFAYVGFAIMFVSAAIAHIAIGDTPGAFMPLFFLALLAASYAFHRKMNNLSILGA